MAPGKDRPLRREDLERAIRSVADQFDTDTVYVVGSQALLVSRPDIARELCYSNEFDMYPGEIGRSSPDEIEASETINALFGEGSQFHRIHSFFIDGVDESTAKLPPDWKDRAVVLEVMQPDGSKVTAIAPSPAEVVAAKLVRGDEKDITFAALCLRFGLVTNAEVKRALSKTLAGAQLEASLKRVDRASRSKNSPERA